MIKRLSVSIALLSVAIFSIGAGAMAWFSTSPGSAGVEITAGTPELEITADVNCDGDDVIGPTNTFNQTLSWAGIVPGETTQDCFDIENTGDGELEVYVQNSSFSGHGSGSGDGLFDALEFTYITDSAANAGPGNADNAAFTTANGGRGMLLGTLGEGESLSLQVNAEFVDSNSNQNDMIGETVGFTSTLTGYTN